MKMKTKALFAFIFLLFLNSLTCIAATPSKVMIHNQLVDPDVVTTHNGADYFYLRPVFEHMGATVRYQADLGSVDVVLHRATLHFKPDSHVVNLTQNGRTSAHYMNLPARIENDRLMVPFDPALNAIGFYYQYDAPANTIVIFNTHFFISQVRTAAPTVTNTIFGIPDITAFTATGNVRADSTTYLEMNLQSLSYDIELDGKMSEENYYINNHLKFRETAGVANIFPVYSIEYESVLHADDLFVKLNPASLIAEGLEDKWLYFQNHGDFPLPIYNFENAILSLKDLNKRLQSLQMTNNLTCDLMGGLDTILDGFKQIEQKTRLYTAPNDTVHVEIYVPDQDMKFLLTLFAPEKEAVAQQATLSHTTKKTIFADGRQNMLVMNSMSLRENGLPKNQSSSSYHYYMTPTQPFRVDTPGDNQVVDYRDIIR